MSELIVQYLGNVALVAMNRPPHNYFDLQLMSELSDRLEAFDKDPQIRCVVLAAEGQSFCAGAQLQNGKGAGGAKLYSEAQRIFEARKPLVAAVHGAAIGGGLGLALAADFRIVARDAKLSANFTRLGFHPGFGLTQTLPDLVGKNEAELMLYTSRRIDGDHALKIGLANESVDKERVRDRALELAAEIASCAPLAVQATRQSMRIGLAERMRQAMQIEATEQAWLKQTDDYKEGVLSYSERRVGNFVNA